VRWVLGSWLGGLSLLPLSIGCAGQSEDTKRQLVSMNERLVVLQNDRDRLMERVDALESRFPSPGVRQDEAATPHVAPARPPLKIVRLEPAPEGVAAEASAEREPAPVDSPVAPPAQTTASEVSHEPKVVLYGEGTTSGVRSSAEGASHR
jgi:hypothetical protein